MDIYNKIDKILEQKNLSRRKLAILAKIPPTTLQSAFSRKTENLSLDTIKKIAEVLETTPFDLVGHEYWDLSLGEEGLEKLRNNVKLLDIIKEQYGETVVNAFGLLVELNSKGQKKAIEYIEDLHEQSKYKKD